MPIVYGPDYFPVEIAPGRGDLNRSSVPFDVFAGGVTGPFWQGRPVSYAKIFGTQAWVAIAVMRLLTWSVRVPLKVYRQVDEDETVRLQGRSKSQKNYHPLAAAVVDPWANGDGTMAELVTNMLGPLLVHGNDLMGFEQGRSDAIRFESLDWRKILPVRADEADPCSAIVGWKIREGDDYRQLSSDKVMHLMWWSPLGDLGISPLEQVRMTILGEDAANRWAYSNLAQGARPNGVVELDSEFVGLDPADRQAMLDNARDDLRNAYAGPDNAGKLPVLPPGLKWTDAKPTTAVEQELIQQRMVHRNEVAAIYQIPPTMVGQLDRATFSNIQVQREMAYTDGLAPPLVIIEQKINSMLCRKLLREDDLFVEFDFAGVLRGDRLKEIQALREAISIGLLAPNEGRGVLNYKPSDADNADKLWMPWNNLQPIDSPPPKKASNNPGGGAAPAQDPVEEQPAASSSAAEPGKMPTMNGHGG